MNDLNTHYRQLLGLRDDWDVVEVDLDLFPQCGVKTISVPWAGKRSRFKLMFEAFAIRVLQASANVSRAASLLGLSWDTAHDLMASAVQRGLER